MIVWGGMIAPNQCRNSKEARAIGPLCFLSVRGRGAKIGHLTLKAIFALPGRDAGRGECGCGMPIALLARREFTGEV
jgi:hypothetical protein